MSQRKPRLILARPDDLDTREGLAAFYKALTGRDATEEELDEAFASDAEASDAKPPSGAT